ncbi:MAG: hypothetical protein LBT48_01240 [Prevotellaceae bacterium]|jgi:hypothetical protein|nr:hypothetical protein [Prevotellaceae bacterium]
MYKDLNKSTVGAHSCNTMETGDHLKNGASPKSQMIRRNINLFALFTLIASAFTFSSCAKDDDTGESSGGFYERTITVKNDIQSPVTSGDAELIYDSNFTVANGQYNNGSVKLQFIKEVPENYLKNVTEYDSEVNKSYLKFSNTNAKILEVSSYIYIVKGGDRIGYIQSDDNDYEYVDYSHIFASEDVSITFTGGENGANGTGVTVDIRLKKGWNIVYYYENEAKGVDWVESIVPPTGLYWEYTSK